MPCNHQYYDRDREIRQRVHTIYSDDGGESWSAPFVLISMPGSDWHKTDCGYPSSVQLDDGTIVTAYYFGPKKPEWAAHGLPWHQRYHMGVARWRPPVAPGEFNPTVRRSSAGWLC